MQEPIHLRAVGEDGFALYAGKWLDSPTPGDAEIKKVQILHLSHHWWQGTVMSGNFEVVLINGRQFKGSFRAKYVKPPHQIICE